MGAVPRSSSSGCSFPTGEPDRLVAHTGWAMGLEPAAVPAVRPERLTPGTGRIVARRTPIAARSCIAIQGKSSRLPSVEGLRAKTRRFIRRPMRRVVRDSRRPGKCSPGKNLGQRATTTLEPAIKSLRASVGSTDASVKRLLGSISDCTLVAIGTSTVTRPRERSGHAGRTRRANRELLNRGLARSIRRKGLGLLCREPMNLGAPGVVV
jgi:hypothetical protein